MYIKLPCFPGGVQFLEAENSFIADTLNLAKQLGTFFLSVREKEKVKHTDLREIREDVKVVFF